MARVCNKQGCPEIIEGRSERYCVAHKMKAWANSTRADKKPAGWQRIRTHILHRDQGTCQYCGQPATEIDHIIPVSRGGTHAPTNLLASCTKCNQEKNLQERNLP